MPLIKLILFEMISIYKIEDINDLAYVGSTGMTLEKRLSHHRYHKRRGIYYSSSKLNLDNCIITLLEECSAEDRTQRERYWINHLDTVNDYKSNFDYKKYYEKNKDKKLAIQREYRKNNKQKIKDYEANHKERKKEYNKQYHEQNKDKIHARQREYRIKRQRHMPLPESREHAPAP